MELKKIGVVDSDKSGLFVKLEEKYIKALKEIEGFSHLHIIWWADQLDDDMYRSIMVSKKPYKPGPEEIGIFATRSPLRPNPICSTIISVNEIDEANGIIRTFYIDAEPGTPVLDIKPYLGCSDRPSSWSVPTWSSMLPKTIEESATFDWESYFNYE